MKIARSKLIPGVLLIYLAVMSAVGWKNLSAGHLSPLEYYGTIALTLAIIVLLHFTIRHHERLRARRSGGDSGSADSTRNQA